MTEPTDAGGKRRPKRAADMRGKLVFFVVAVVLAGVVYWYLQQGRAILRDWPDDLGKALHQARAEDRKVLAFFISSSPGETTSRMARTTLRKSHNQRAIATGGFLRVKVSLDPSLKSDTARRYRIAKLPTMLVLDADGKELNRREGMIGEVPFRSGFLDCTEVVEPPSN